MEIILLKDIAGVGRKGEVKNVAEGYAGNFLLPRKMAVAATPKEIERLNMERLKDDEKRKTQEESLDKNLDMLSDKKITIKSKANETGHLFAGIHKDDILKALKEQVNMGIPKESLDFSENIKSIGTYKIPVAFKNKKGEFELVVETL